VTKLSVQMEERLTKALSAAVAKEVQKELGGGTHFTCFNGTKVQILTLRYRHQDALAPRARRAHTLSAGVYTG
jgi:hypothetical protein